MKRYLCCLILLACCRPADAQDGLRPLRLWYQQPATDWNEALPVGNGRLGAMVFGKTDVERVQINEESVWGGRSFDDNNPDALTYLPQIRALLLDDRNAEAYDLATRHLLATPPTVRSYQTLMDLHLDLWNDAAPAGYRRELDLRTGIARTEYTVGGVRYVREVFASAPDDVLIVRLASDAPGTVNVTARLSRPQDARVEARSHNALVLSGQIVDADTPRNGSGGANMRFAGVVRAYAEGGALQVLDGDKLQVAGADAVLFVITAATDYDAAMLALDPGKDPVALAAGQLDRLGAPAFERLKQRHVADHRALMDRVAFDLGTSNDAVPTDQRLAAVQEGTADPDLVTLYFQLGRYLLMGSSRSPGVLPANLQGLWNEHIDAPWGSDYHTNINVQMNYWPAEVTNLAETAQPLIRFVDRLRVPGRVTAQAMYGASGWTMHHNTDLFGKTGLHDGIHWGTFPIAGPWMTFPVWRHYEYSGDRAYLRDVAYPILKESAAFVLDFLIEDRSGRLVTAPSYSPENAFVHPRTGEPTQLTYAPTMDIQIIAELFAQTTRAAQILGVDAAFRDTLAATLQRLPPARIGRDGTIQEWIEDYEEAEPGHRHMSHLFSLHPGAHINPGTPALFEAARKTIERRLAHGGGHTGWSRAWIINFFARLRDGEQAYENVQALLQKSTLTNLFDTHPPFQIDGNFGGTAGLAEMLLQSHLGTMDLLPALPAAWPAGRITGLRARGGFEVDQTWEGEALTRVVIRSTLGGPCTLRYNGTEQTVETEPGGVYVFDGRLQPE